MSNKNVNILLKLQDQLTGPMKNVSKEVKQQQKAMHKLNSSVYSFSRSVRSTFLGGIAHVGKFGLALAGVSGVLSAAGIKNYCSSAIEGFNKAQEAAAKLEAVLGNVPSIIAQGDGAAGEAAKRLSDYAAELANTGVVGKTAAVSGLQQLATFQLTEESLKKLLPGMEDLLAQQKGVNATNEDAIAIANLVGKAMSGQTGALSRAGIIMTDYQKKVMQTGNEEQRAAMMAEILRQNVGGVNAALAQTDAGKMKVLQNQLAGMKSQIGGRLQELKNQLVTIAAQYIPMVQEGALHLIDKVQPYLEKGINWIGTHMEDVKNAVLKVKDGVVKAWGMIQPIVTFAIKHAETLIPLILGVVGAISAASIVADVATKISFGVKKFIDLRNAVKEVGGVLSWLKTGPIGLIIIGIAAAVAAIVYLWNHCEKFREIVKKVAAKAVEYFNGIKTTIIILKNGAVAAFTTLRDKVVGAFNAIKEKVAPVIQWIKDRVEDIKKLINSIKQFASDVTSGPWVDNGGGGSGSELHGHATGTSYWRGGPTYVNEGRRGEIINLPSGTQIIPHDVSMAAAKGGGKSVTVNVNIAGNVIGNREYAEELGSYIARKILNAEATV